MGVEGGPAQEEAGAPERLFPQMRKLRLTTARSSVRHRDEGPLPPLRRPMGTRCLASAYRDVDSCG